MTDPVPRARPDPTGAHRTPLTFIVVVLAANWTARFISSGRRALPIVFGILFVSSLATLGGVTEYFSMAVGYHVLAVAVAAAYLVAFIMLWDASRASAPAADATAVGESESSGPTGT